MYKTIFGIIILLLTLNGCVIIPIPYLPLHRQYSGKEPSEIHVGSTTRSQVIELLGDANILDEEGYFLTEVDSRSPGFYIFAGVFAYGAGLAQFSDLTVIRVLIEFDENDIVRRIETSGELPKDKLNLKEKNQSWITRKSDIPDANYNTTLKTGSSYTNFGLQFSPDDKWLIAIDKPYLRYHKLFVWDVSDIIFGSQIHPKFVFPNSWFVKFSPDKTHYATLINNYRFLNNSHVLSIFNFDFDIPESLFFSENAIAWQAHLYIHSRYFSKPRLLGPYFDLNMDWSSDGEKLAFSIENNKKIAILNLSGQVTTLEADNEKGTPNYGAIKFFPNNNKRIVTSVCFSSFFGIDDCQFKIWDTESGKEIKSTLISYVPTKSFQKFNMAISPNGKLLATIASDKTCDCDLIKLWDLLTGSLITERSI